MPCCTFSTARFWHKVLFDLGIVSTDEPFTRLFNQGMILAFAYETATGGRVSSDQITEKEGTLLHNRNGRGGQADSRQDVKEPQECGQSR
ncbi:MAG: hypothetical protein MZV63_59245 [Marinilabiliales bacterium]|nr:hypothetical protein [Marinilabiliales bacterium]